MSSRQKSWRKHASAILTFMSVGIAAAGCNGDGGENTDRLSSLEPPQAKVIPEQLKTHGHTRIDNYYWLNQRENP